MPQAVKAVAFFCRPVNTFCICGGLTKIYKNADASSQGSDQV